MNARLTELREWAFSDAQTTFATKSDVRDLYGELNHLALALEKVVARQKATLAWLRSNGIVFDGPLGTDPGNWQHVAFSIYTDLCEAETIARQALEERLDGSLP